MKKLFFGCILRPLRKLVGFFFILMGTVPTLLIPGIGLFLGLPFLLIGGLLIAC